MAGGSIASTINAALEDKEQALQRARRSQSAALQAAMPVMPGTAVTPVPAAVAAFQPLQLSSRTGGRFTVTACSLPVSPPDRDAAGYLLPEFYRSTKLVNGGDGVPGSFTVEAAVQCSQGSAPQFSTTVHVPHTAASQLAEQRAEDAAARSGAGRRASVTATTARCQLAGCPNGTECMSHTFTSTQPKGPYAAVWDFLGKKGNVAGAELFGYNHDSVQALLTPPAPSTASALATVREVLGTPAPPAWLNQNFSRVTVAEMQDRRRQHLVSTLGPLVCSLVERVAPADPGGALVAVAGSRYVVDRLQLQQNALYSEAQLARPFCQHLKQSYQAALAKGNRKTAKQLLSLAAADLSKPQLMLLFGCTEWQARAAKQHVALNGAGQVPPTIPRKLSRISAARAQQLLQFKQRDDVVRRPAFCKNRTKTPYLERIHCRAVLYRMYVSEAAALGLKPVHPSFFYKALGGKSYRDQVPQTCMCPQCLKGILTFRGLAALIKETFVLPGTIAAQQKPMAASLASFRQYLRLEYSQHLSVSAPGQSGACDGCATHCTAHALSGTAPHYNQQQCTHSHVMSCADCNQRFAIPAALRQQLQAAAASAAAGSAHAHTAARLLEQLEELDVGVGKYMAHKVRCLHQRSGSRAVLGSLAYNQAKAVFDYKEKLLPAGHLEAQSDAVGLAGISVHGTVFRMPTLPASIRAAVAEEEDPDELSRILSRTCSKEDDWDGEYMMLTVVTVCEDNKQNWYHTLSQIDASV